MAFTGKTGADWSGIYSRWNFDEAKAYLMVAKMMLEPGTNNGIPLLDAELNEQAEILITLGRRMAHRIYGNGTTGNGFKIVQSASNPNNNFTIMGGDGTPAGAGSIFVEGWMPTIPSNIEYSAQGYGPAALTTPVSNRVDAVYIDVYYKEVDRVQDGAIVDPTINMETSRRIALVWEVKVAEGASVPAKYTDANNIQHWTLKLATINRLAGNSQIAMAMIVDERNSGRLVAMIAELTAHINATSVHGATSAATANRLIVRDNAGRAQVAAPSAPNDIARKAEIDAEAQARVAGDIPADTKMLFIQTVAPTGWTKDTEHNNKTLRVVSGDAGSGGSIDFTTAFASDRGTTGTAVSGTVGATTLTTTMIPSHKHIVPYGERSSTYSPPWGFGDASNAKQGGDGFDYDNSWPYTSPIGSGGSHYHSFSSPSHAHKLNMDVKYVDTIIATKD
jgi:hypothetical protein